MTSTHTLFEVSWEVCNKVGGIHTVLSTKAKSLVDIPIIVPRAETSDRIQEIHIKVIHIVIETVEREMFPRNYS